MKSQKKQFAIFTVETKFENEGYPLGFNSIIRNRETIYKFLGITYLRTTVKIQE